MVTKLLTAASAWQDAQDVASAAEGSASVPQVLKCAARYPDLLGFSSVSPFPMVGAQGANWKPPGQSDASTSDPARSERGHLTRREHVKTAVDASQS